MILLFLLVTILIFYECILIAGAVIGWYITGVIENGNGKEDKYVYKRCNDNSS